MAIIDGDQVVAIHTNRGVPVTQFLAEDQVSMRWTRTLRETSRCELAIAGIIGEQLPALQPGLHWVSVWSTTNDREPLWRGVVHDCTARRSGVTITAFDVSWWTTRTRVPLSKRWEAEDPALIAAEMWSAMIELNQFNVHPVVRTDPWGDRFAYKVTADEKMVDSVVADLVAKGLRWSVVAGTPVLGPASLTSIAALGENDFLGAGLSVVRSAAMVFNDVLLRAGDAVSRARADMAGLNLQTIVTADSVFGVSNADKETRQYVRHTGKMRDALILDDGTVLHPDAPVGINQLVPSARLTVTAFGLPTTMELTNVTVTVSSDQSTVAVSAESINDELPELLDTRAKGGEM